MYLWTDFTGSNSIHIPLIVNTFNKFLHVEYYDFKSRGHPIGRPTVNWHYRYDLESLLLLPSVPTNKAQRYTARFSPKLEEEPFASWCQQDEGVSNDVLSRVVK